MQFIGLRYYIQLVAFRLNKYIWVVVSETWLCTIDFIFLSQWLGFTWKNGKILSNVSSRTRKRELFLLWVGEKIQISNISVFLWPKRENK